MQAVGLPQRSFAALVAMVLSFILIQNRQYVSLPTGSAPSAVATLVARAIAGVTID
jgi:hypothetical protein